MSQEEFQKEALAKLEEIRRLILGKKLLAAEARLKKRKRTRAQMKASYQRTAKLFQDVAKRVFSDLPPRTSDTGSVNNGRNEPTNQRTAGE